MSIPVPKENLSRSAQTLKELMQRAKIPSQRALATKANVSRWQVQQLRQGNLNAMRVAVLNQLATALDCSILELLEAFSPSQLSSNATTPAGSNHEIDRLRQEYARLQQRLEQQLPSIAHSTCDVCPAQVSS